MRIPSIKDPLFWILAVALVARLIAALLVPDQGFPDVWTYRGAGAQFREFHILTYTDIMPLYPILLTFVGSGWGQKVADIVLSVAMVWLIYAITIRIYRDEAIALAAALFAALWPHFIFFAAIGLTETLFIVLVLAGLLTLYREHYWLGSVFLVLSILTRPASDPLAPILILIFALFVHRRSFGFAASRIAVYALVYVALIAPWWLHNYAKYGEFVRLNVAGGMVLYTGNNPVNQSGGGISKLDTNFANFVHIENRVRRSEAYTKAALDYIRAEPAHFVYMAGVKLARLWRPWPHVEEYRNPLIIFISAASALPAFALALFGLAATGRKYFRQLLPCFCVVGFLTLVHAVTFGSVRYRIPMEPFVLLLAGAGLVEITRRFELGRSLLAQLSPRTSA